MINFRSLVLKRGTYLFYFAPATFLSEYRSNGMTIFFLVSSRFENFRIQSAVINFSFFVPLKIVT